MVYLDKFLVQKKILREHIKIINMFSYRTLQKKERTPHEPYGKSRSVKSSENLKKHSLKMNRFRHIQGCDKVMHK